MSDPSMDETTTTRPTNDLPPMPKATITVYVILATIVVFGLGMAVGGHEWQRIGLQTGIVLIAGSVTLAIGTGLMHLAYSAGWKKRGIVVHSAQTNARDLSTEDQTDPTESTALSVPTASEDAAAVDIGESTSARVAQRQSDVVEASDNGSKVPVGSR
jgi:hypothetical protein